VEKAHQVQQLATSNWLAGGEEKYFKIMTDGDIINNALEDDKSENE
jgi:hypothetical protein